MYLYYEPDDMVTFTPRIVFFIIFLHILNHAVLEHIELSMNIVIGEDGNPLLSFALATHADRPQILTCLKAGST